MKTNFTADQHCLQDRTIILPIEMQILVRYALYDDAKDT